MARRAGEQIDLGQSLVVVGWNLAIAGGGALGGTVLKNAGAAMLPWPLIAVLLATLWMTLAARKAWA